jgi:phosphatidylglycerol:prolipoprotein diacylglycerol transferase
LHFPVTINIGSLHILLHTVTEPLCMFIGFRYYLFLRKKQGDVISSEHRLWIFIGAIAGAILGSRLTGGFENPPALFASANPWLYIYSNKTVLGGFIGGLFGVELIKKIVGEKHSSGDLFTYPMIFALIIGRIGCFSMGLQEETYGTPTRLFAGINFGDGILRHPVCLYEMAFLILLWISLLKLEKKMTLKPGSRFKIFMISYMLFRFLLDFIKPHYTFSFGLSTIQLVCLIGLLYYLRNMLQPKKIIVQNA